MIQLVALKALAGFNHVRVDQVIAITAMDQTKCQVIMTGGITVPCSEPAKDVIAKLEAASGKKQPEPAPAEQQGADDGDARG